MNRPRFVVSVQVWRSTRELIVILSLLFLLHGCTVGPDSRPPRSQVPGAFIHARAASPPATNETLSTLADWWTAFGDARLSALMSTAMVSNLDVRLAQARVRESRAHRGVARSAFWPEVDARAGYARSRQAETSPAGLAFTALGLPLENSLFDAALDMSWEIDVFGGTRRAAEAAQADLEASVESRRDTLVTVLAEVGLTYLDLRGTQQQLAVARDNLQTQEQTLALTRDRFQAGLGSELDSARAEAQVAATRARIPPLEEARQRAIHRLSVLLGMAPADLSSELRSVDSLPAAIPRVPIGLPSDLLLHRPDLRRAERQLAAATARIGLARADWFPKFYLTGAAGLQSLEAGDFLDAGSRFWSLGPSVRWPLFNAGRIRQNVRVQDARQEQALLRYEQTLLIALEEVENALLGFGQEQERRRALADSESATRRAVTLAIDRHRGGLIGFLDVLEAQRSLLAVQDEKAQSERRLGQNLVRLYKALGGGWQPADHTDAAAAVTGR